MPAMSARTVPCWWTQLLVALSTRSSACATGQVSGVA